MAGPLDKYLPIRTILVDGVEQPFVRDLDLDADTFEVTTDTVSGVASLGLKPGVTSGSIEGTFAKPLVITGRKYYDISGLTPLSVTVAPTGHDNGGSAVLISKAYTRPSIALPDEINSEGDAFDPAYGYEIEITHHYGLFRAFTRVLRKPDLKAPEILWVHVHWENPVLVEVKFNKPVSVADLDLISIAGATPTAVHSGDGTDEITFVAEAAVVPSTDTIDFGEGAVISMFGTAMPVQAWDTRWRIDPTDPDLQMTSYRDATVERPTTAAAVWPTAGEWDDAVNWTNGSHAPGYSGTEGIDGEGACIFVASEGDVISSALTVTGSVGTANGAAWIMTWPGQWLKAAGFGSHEYPSLLGGGGALNLTTYKPSGTDNEKVDFLSYSESLPGYESLLVPAVPRQPALIRARWNSGTKYGKVGDRAESSVAFGNLPSWASSQAFRVGGLADLDRNTDQRWMAVLTTKVDPATKDVELLEAVDSHFMRLPGAGFMRPQPTPASVFVARVGQALEIPWGAIMLYPTAPASADFTWLTFSVTGITGATVGTRNMSWTPGSGDLGLKTVTVIIEKDGKTFRRFSFGIFVVSASTTGAIKVCLLGDSWTDGGNLGHEICTALEAQGYTVTMLGSRGGYGASAINTTTDIITVTNPSIAATGDPIELFDSAGKLPAPLTEYTTYYAEKVDPTPTQIKVRATSGGAAIDLTSDGWQTFSVNTTTGLITCTAHGFVGKPKAFSRKPILRVRANGGTIPTGLVAGTDYYFTQVDANSGYLSITYGGPYVIPSTAGSGAFQIGPAYVHVRTPKQRHEGRGGWSHEHYLTAEGNPVMGPGPFIDPATELFSYSYLKTNNLGGVSPDFFIDQLGINGGLNSGIYGRQRDAMIAHARSTIAMQAQTIASAVLLAEPTTKFMAAIPAYPACIESMFASDYGTTYSAWEWSQAVYHLQVAYQLAFEDREAERIFVGTFQVLDTQSDFANSVHPASHVKDGTQMALAIRRAKDWTP